MTQAERGPKCRTLGLGRRPNQSLDARFLLMDEWRRALCDSLEAKKGIWRVRDDWPCAGLSWEHL